MGRSCCEEIFPSELFQLLGLKAGGVCCTHQVHEMKLLMNTDWQVLHVDLFQSEEHVCVANGRKSNKSFKQNYATGKSGKRGGRPPELWASV